MSGNAAVSEAGELQIFKSQWAWHLGALGALLALILGLFQYEVVNAVQVWWIYPTYSHCFLILPISLWLIWGMRDELRATSPSLAPQALALVPVILLIWVAAKLATINEVRQLAVVALIQVALLAMLGTRIYRMILFPALFLFFLVPMGQYLIGPMQQFATWFTDNGLTLMGVPHYTEGTLIELANGRFEIAEACAGLRFLIATITLGVLFAHLTYRKWWKIALFLVSCIVIPLIGNGFRCIGIIMLAHLTDNKVAVGADHLVYGWGFNMLILAVVFLIGVRFRDPMPEHRPLPGGDMRAFSRASVLLLAAATAVAMSTGPAFAYWHETKPVIANIRAFTAPLALDGWTATPPAKDWSPFVYAPDGEMKIGLVKAGEPPVDLAVEYYGRMRERHSLVAGTNRLWDPHDWHAVARGAATSRLGALPVRFNEATIVSTNERRLVWSVYWMDGRFITRPLTVKLLQIKTALTGNEGAALVVLSTPIEGAVDDARARLAASVQALGELPSRLALAGQAGAPAPSAPRLER